MLDKINLQDIIQIAHKAGDAIMDIYHRDFEVEYKADQSPLTEADKAAHKIIEAELIKINLANGTQLPLLSEEGKDIP